MRVPEEEGNPAVARAGRWIGPLAMGAMLLVAPPAGLSEAGWRCAAVGVLMAVWWVTEALPISATALVPRAAFPLLGVAAIQPAAAPYGDPIVFLFLSGFLLAGAMQRWGLHRRVALRAAAALGTSRRGLVGGVMAATGLLSMWVSNTATAVMMLPIGLSVAALARGEDGEGDGAFAGAMMLGVAYASSIGGLGTLIGTPPNALLAGFMRATYGVEVGFGRWMLVGVPMVALLLPLCWLLLTRVTYRVGAGRLPGGREVIVRELRALGPLTWPEAAVALAFGAAAVLWVFSPAIASSLPKGTLSDAGIGIAAALALFLVPAGKGRGAVLDWATAVKVPWEVLLLFGGGLSLAAAIGETGLAAWIGGRLGGLGALPTPVLVLAVCVVIVALSEVASNTATAAAFLPVVASLAVGVGENPLLLAVPAVLAASCGFMLPVATPPNAIAYATGHVRGREMLRAGAWLDVLCIAAILAAAYTVLLWAFGVAPGVLPSWAVTTK
jgi:sodium-dependent dicarboxylate transporter 2/3/5